MSLSKIVVSGRVIRGPEKRFTPNNNVAVTEFAIAVESPPRPDGTIETQPVRVITWRDLAERCAQEVKKGDLVAVDGRLQVNSYTTQEGLRRREAEIEAIAVENLSQTLSKSEGSVTEQLDRPVARVGAGTETRPAGPSQQDDLESLFAGEDEIPF